MLFRKLRSEPVLWSFVKYCIKHPHERFWQALKNWSGYPSILVGSMDEEPWKLIAGADTYSWEGRREDEP